MKKLLSAVLAAMLMLSISAPAALADEIENAEVLQLLEETNEAINEEIEDAQAAADALDPNADDYEEELDEIITELVEETEEIANEAVEEANELGYDFEKQYVEVQVGDRTVEVDPIHVGS